MVRSSLQVLIGAITVVLVALFGLHRALGRRAFWIASSLLVAWFVAALLLTQAAFFQGTSTSLPAIPFGLFIPIAVGVALFYRWRLFREMVEALPQSWIVGIQLYRLEGLTFLVLYAAGRLPGAFALPAGIGDVLVGALAPIAAIAYARGARHSSAWLRAWNFLGIADLVVAVTTGFLTSPSPVQLLALDHPNQLIGAFPLAIIPVFLVPLSVLLHLASLKKLRRMAPKALKVAA